MNLVRLMNLGCSPDWFSFSVLQANRLMEEVVKMKGAEAAAMAAPSMEALEKQGVEEEGEPPEEWMVADVSSSDRLKRVWMCLLCWYVTENANPN